MANDVITAQLAHQKRQEQSLKEVSDTHTIVRGTESVAATTRWVAIGTLIIVLFLSGAAVPLVSSLNRTHVQVHESEVRISAQIDKVVASLPRPLVTVELQQWTSVAFAPGSVVCDGKKNPCNCWYAVTAAAPGDCVDVGTIAARNRDAVAVIATGGHDKARLIPRSEPKLGSNDHIAIVRAQLVADSFTSSLNSSEGAQVPTVRTTARGMWDHEKQSSSDRTVTITLVKPQGAQ